MLWTRRQQTSTISSDISIQGLTITHPVHDINNVCKVEHTTGETSSTLFKEYCGFELTFKILLLTSKAFNGLAPFYLQELISLKEACKYKLRSDCDGLLISPLKFKTSTTLGDRSFTAAAPQLWNSLPYSIRSSPSVASFKKTLKTFLFQKAFL